MIRLEVMESTLGLMVDNTKVSGNEINLTEAVFIKLQTGQSMMVNGEMVSDMDLEDKHKQMEKFMKEDLKREKIMGWV